MLNCFSIKRNQIFIFCVILTHFFACKKDKIDDFPFISATIDGIQHSFTKDVGASKGSQGSIQLFLIGNDGQDAIAFALSDTTTGDYSELNTPSQGKVLNVQLITLQGLHRSVMDNTDPCKLTITTINSKYVEGYFNGTLVGQSTKKLTNGKFKVYFYY